MAEIEIGYSSPKESSKEEAGEVKDNFNRRNETVNIRKIKNGFIVKKCWEEGKKEKSRYCEEEEYFKSNPL